jgi:hypothetical protein
MPAHRSSRSPMTTPGGRPATWPARSRSCTLTLGWHCSTPGSSSARRSALDTVCDVMAASPLGTAADLPGPSLLGFVACAALVRTAAFEAVGGFDSIIRFPGEEERLALDLAAAGWGLAYVDELTVHHHPRRDGMPPHRRQAGVWRSRLLTALMRLPAADVAPVTARAARSGPCGWQGLLRAVPDAPVALQHRGPIPPRVLADRRRLAGDAV